MNAVVYYRVSSRSQEDNTSLENQKNEIDKYARQKDIEIIKRFQDVASGGNGNRKGFMGAVEFIEENSGKIDVFIVFKYDRAHRNLRETLNFVHRLDQKDIAYISVSQNIDTTTPQGKAFFHMLCTFAEFEKEIIRERCHDGRKAKIRKKKAPGNRPVLGYDENWRVKEGIAGIVKDLFRSYLRLDSLAKLAEYTKRQGYDEATELALSRRTLRNILRNRAYLGEFAYDGRREKHGVLWKKHHEAIIAFSIFGKVQKRLDSNRKRR